MSLSCADLIIKLQNIRELQDQLNRQIEDFVALRNAIKLNVKDAAHILVEIYIIRKQLTNELMSELDIFLRSLPELPEGNPREITINLGIESRDDISEKFHSLSLIIGGKRKTRRVEGFAYSMINSSEFIVATKEKRQKLVFLTVGDLCRGDAKAFVRINEIKEAIKKLGLKICPPEVGPQLALQYEKCPTCAICMKPIKLNFTKYNKYDPPQYFRVVSSKEEIVLKADSDDGNNNNSYHVNSIFVCCRD